MTQLPPLPHPAAAIISLFPVLLAGVRKKINFLDRKMDHCNMGWSRWKRAAIIEIEQGVGRTCKKSMGPKQEGKNFKTLPHGEQLKELKVFSGEVKIHEKYDSSLHIFNRQSSKSWIKLVLQGLPSSALTPYSPFSHV